MVSVRHARNSICFFIVDLEGYSEAGTASGRVTSRIVLEPYVYIGIRIYSRGNTNHGTLAAKILETL